MVQDALSRFRTFCQFESETGCVVWTGARTKGRGHHVDYSAFWYNGRKWFGHRWAAQYIHGLDIEAFQVDHCCPHIPIPNTLCVQHLQALTPRDNRYVILALINVMLLALGTLMDMAPLILILTPILLPVVTGLGIDPVHFGMIMMVNLGIGLITPPVGTVLFVGSAVAKLPIGVVTKAAMPFFFALFIVLLFVTYVPGLSLWLPRALGL